MTPTSIITEYGGLAASLCSLITLALLFCKPVQKWIYRRVISPGMARDENLRHLELRLDSLESWQAKQQLDIELSLREQHIILRALKASLESLAQLEDNGNIASSIAEIDQFLLHQAHQPKSRQ
ncbi:MAG: hypothetical protein Q4C55_08635 [Eubacterium sp.]|nr:hypothetical protein [Eubacterium sp.]